MYNESMGRDVYTAPMLQQLQDGSNPDRFANTKWADELFQTAPMTQHNLSVNGGSKDVHYMLSVGYLYQDGILKRRISLPIIYISSMQELAMIMQVVTLLNMHFAPILVV